MSNDGIYELGTLPQNIRRMLDWHPPLTSLHDSLLTFAKKFHFNQTALDTEKKLSCKVCQIFLYDSSCLRYLFISSIKSYKMMIEFAEKLWRAVRYANTRPQPRNTRK